MQRYWFTTLLYICSTWPSYDVPILHPLACQHLPSSLKMFLCVSGISTKLGVWGPNRCWDIEFPTPTCICSTWPRFGHWCSSHGCANISQVVWNVPMCLTNLQRSLRHGALIDAKILTPPLPNVFGWPGQDMDTDTLPVGVKLPPKSSENVPMCLRNLQKTWCMRP